MKTEPGRLYDVTLAITHPTGDAAWLVAAVAARYPAEVLDVSSFDAGAGAVTTVQWVGPIGDIDPGDALEATGPLPVLPGTPRPTAVVTSVGVGSAGPSAGPGKRVGWTLAAGCAILGFVAYAVHRIGAGAS